MDYNYYETQKESPSVFTWICFFISIGISYKVFLFFKHWDENKKWITDIVLEYRFATIMTLITSVIVFILSRHGGAFIKTLLLEIEKKMKNLTG